MKRQMAQHERMQLLAVWAEEKEMGRGKKQKLGLPQPVSFFFFFIGWKVKSEVTSDSLYLSQIFFFPLSGSRSS